MRRKLALLVLFTFMFSLFPAVPVQAAGPVISEVSPAIMPPGGGQLVISGSGLGAAGTKVILQIGAKAIVLEGADIVSTGSGFVVVTVPSQDLTEFDATGIIQVNNLILANDDGSANKANPFKYMQNPSISHSYPFTIIDKYDDNGNPSTKDADRKTFLKIEGGYFDWVDKVYLKEKDALEGSAIKFGNFESPAGQIFKDASDGGIYIEVSNILRGKEVEVKVENVGGYSSLLTEADCYNEPGPYVSSFDPRPAPIFVGSKLELTGANLLNELPENTRVYIGGVRALIENVSSNSIRATVPNPQLGNRDIQIEVWDAGKRRGMSVYKNAVDIKLVPSGIKLDQVLPNHGPVGGGNKAVIVGEKFDQTMTVFFEIDGKSLPASDCKTIEPPSYVGEGKTAFEVTVPPSPDNIQGPAKVKVVDRIQTGYVFAEKENGYFYSTAAQYLNLQSVTPGQIPFDQLTGLVLGGQYFSYFRNIPSTKRLELPDGTSSVIGDVNIISVDDSGVSPLKLIQEIPGYYEGKDFRIERTIMVTTGGVMADIKALNTVGNVQYLNVISRVYPLGNKLEEQVDVQVTVSEKTFYFDEGQWKECIDQTYYPLAEIGILSGGLTITRTYPEPEITSITPTYGPNLREQKAVIEGYNFFEGVAITFAGAPAIINSLKQGAFDPERGFIISIEVSVPATTVRGQVDVIVANTDGKFAAAEYTYVSSPAITSISPNIAPETGGNHATLTGSRFMANSAVLIGDQLVCANEYTGDVMDNLLADDFFEQFGISTLDKVIDPDYRVVGADGSELQSSNNQPEGTKIIFQVPEGTQGLRDVYVINTDKGWDKLAQGMEYKVDNGSGSIVVTPNEGSVEGGQEITISGSGFLPNPYNPVTGVGIIVTIDGAEAIVKQVSGNNQTLTVITPPGSRVGVWTPVEVMNVSPEGIRLDVKEDGFRYHRVLTLPEIRDFFPKHGEKGILVTVFGENFATDPAAQIIFGNEALEGVEVINDGAIIFPVPDNLLPGWYEITVKNPDTGMDTAKDRFELQIPSSKPEIIDISPGKGTLNGGTDVIVEGWDLHKGAELYLGGLPATNIQVDLLEYDEDEGVWRGVIRAKTPARADDGTVDVLVVNPDGGSARLENAFKYVRSSSKPIIKSVQPNQGPASGGQEVIIDGEDFRVARNADNEIDAWPQVTFGGHVAAIVMDDTILRSQGTQIKVVTPVYTGGGRVDVTISNPDTGTSTLAGAYTYAISKPVITSVMPTKFSRHQDSPGLIKGSGFLRPEVVSDPNDPDQNISLPGTDVLLGDQNGQVFKSLNDYPGGAPRVTVLNNQEIRVVIPAADRIGARILRVMNPDGGYADYRIEYVSPVDQPAITEVNPSQGSLKGGTNVAVYGANFADRLEVYFGDQRATVIQQSAESIVVRTPAISLPEGVFEKAVDVIVINLTDYGTAYMIDGYTYVQVESEIAIKEITPSQGPIQGGTTVNITGEGFRDGCSVFFGTVEAESVVYVNSSHLRAITPSHPKGTVDVTVRNPGPDYAEAHVEGGFTFEASMPSDFTAELWNQRAIKLSWTPSEFSSSYEIYVNNTDNSNSSEFLVTTNDTSYIFEKIESGKRYYFWLRTVNQQGASPLIACEDNPVNVSSSDVSKRPPTAKIDDTNTGIEGDRDDLKILVGNDISYWHYAYYDIQLDGKQRSGNQVEILIPSSGIDKNSTTTIRVAGNNYKLEIPLRALKTFEYQEFSRVNQNFNVHVYLTPASPGYLESLKVNRPGFSPVSGFDVLVTMKSNRQETGMNLLAGDIYVSWSAGGASQGRERIYGYDSFSRKWLDYTSFADTSTGMIRARVGKPNTFIIGR
ncbi:MAG: hypothetical protein GXY50_09260 [Syntrophomonadaceae bacterium]|nr:hypothetical protein [Syntrophomonadaceae bacterium]